MHLGYGCEGFLGNYEGDVRDNFYSCNAGISVGSVLIDGSISACPSIRSNFHQGNIYRDDFMEVWENRFHSFFRYCEGNGMHLRDEAGELLLCHLKRLS